MIIVNLKSIADDDFFESKLIRFLTYGSKAADKCRIVSILLGMPVIYTSSCMTYL